MAHKHFTYPHASVTHRFRNIELGQL